MIPPATVAAALGAPAELVDDGIVAQLPATRPDAPALAVWAALDHVPAVDALLTLARERPDGIALELRLHGPSGAAGLPACAARVGFALDHPAPIGTVVRSLPALHRVEVRMRAAGDDDARTAIARARAALEPQLRVRAHEHGLDVLVACAAADRNERLAWVVERCHEAANAPDACCDVDVRMTPLRDGYALRPGHTALRLATTGLRALGRPVRQVDGDDRAAARTAARLAGGQPVVSLGTGGTPGELLALLRALARQGALHGEE